MKISPLRAGIEALNKLKNNKETVSPSSNPFASAFRGKVIQMDVFESANPVTNFRENISNFFKNTSLKINTGYSNLKENMVSFMGKAQKVLNTKIDFNPLKYSASNLQKQPVSELKAMLINELKGV